MSAAAAVFAVRKIHEPVEALNYGVRNPSITQVCTGCGTDDGNWEVWPCPTIRAVNQAMLDVETVRPGRLTQVREVFVDSMIDHELHEQAGQQGGSLVSLTSEYRDQLATAFGTMFDEAVSDHVASVAAILEVRR